MKRFLATLLTGALLALPAASARAATSSRDDTTGKNVIVGSTLIGVPTMLWGFVGWAAADSLAAATIGGAVFFAGMGVAVVGAGCALDLSLCGRAFDAGHDAVVGVAGRIAGAFDRIENGDAPSCPLR